LAVQGRNGKLNLKQDFLCPEEKIMMTLMIVPTSHHLDLYLSEIRFGLKFIGLHSTISSLILSV